MLDTIIVYHTDDFLELFASPLLNVDFLLPLGETASD